MKHKRFEENILVDEAYTNYGKADKNEDQKKGQGIAKHFAESIEYEDKKKWYDQMPQEPNTACEPLSPEQVEELRKEASSALHGDTKAYETKSSKSGSSDHQWARTLLNKGAIGDRVAAATILIQDNPLYNLTTLRNLINNVKPAKKKDGIAIIDAVSELLVSELLPAGAKLRPLARRPLAQLPALSAGSRHTRRHILKLWYFEDQLKDLYGTYVDALNKFAHDSVDANKEKAVSAMAYLLLHHPEREKMLLSNIVNKLGDPASSVASKAVYHLCQLLYNHPNMKAVVLAEIEKMLFRSNISARAQYYGVCFLNQFYLGKDDAAVAENLVRIYFSFFRAAIKKGDIDSRLMSAILTGVKRAFPYADGARLAGAGAAGQPHVAAVHKLVHLAPAGVAIRALALLFHISGASEDTSDRFYSALYRKLALPSLWECGQTALLASLVYRALRRDRSPARVAAFARRLLQLAAGLPPAPAAGLLLLLSQVLKDADKKEALQLVWTKREIKEEVKEENLTKNDQEDTTAEVDGTLDSTLESAKEEEETQEEKPEVKKVDLLRGDKKDLLMDDDEEETYIDLKIDDQGNVKPKRRKPAAGAAGAAGWFHARVKPEHSGDHPQEDKPDKELEAKILLRKTINSDKVVSEYNPLARNPLFAGAERSASVELVPLARHYHPTVRLFAERLLAGQVIQYSGDPLKDFAGIRFLDRFVFKNPKRRTEAHDDGDVKKVKGSHPKFAIRKNYSAKGLKSIPVTSSSYLNEEAGRIPVDERFLYDFLQKKRASPPGESAEPGESDSDDDSVSSDDFHRYLSGASGRDGAEDEELDFLRELETSREQRPRAHQPDAGPDLGDDDDDGDDDEGDGDSDGALDMSADDDEPALSADEQELLLEDSDEDDQVDMPGQKAGKGKNKFKLKGKDDLGSLFASAEEFSTLLEETASNKKQGSSQAVANTDNASAKQLAWEDKRDTWIKGFNRKILGNKPKKGKNKKFQKSGNTNNKMADKKKGGKRKGANENSAGGKKRKIK